MINNKGLTLVELLAAIAILGIMSGIGITAVSKILQNSREKYYESLKSNIIISAKSYYADHRSMLPKLRKTRRLTVEKLVQTKYLESTPMAHDKKTSCENGSYIEVTKVGKSKYEYSIYLKCGSISEELTNGKK